MEVDGGNDERGLGWKLGKLAGTREVKKGVTGDRTGNGVLPKSGRKQRKNRRRKKRGKRCVERVPRRR